MVFWVCVPVIVAVLFVGWALRRYYHRRIKQILDTHDAAKNDFALQLQASRVNKENFETILSSMVEGVMVIDAQGVIVHASANFCRLLELRSKEIQGKLYWEMIWNREINDSLKEALQHTRALKKEIAIMGPQESFFSMQISPVIANNGELFSLIAVFHDITELKKLERVRAEFVANVSHELKTPLTAIKGFVETLRACLKDDPEAVSRFLDIIDKQTQRLENLVNDLLILSVIESRDVKMNFVPELLTPIIQQALFLQKKNLDDKKHEVTLDVPEDLPKVLVDRQRLEQVFLNLLENAVKFTPPGGKIHLQARWEAPFVRVDIRDTGVGIPAEHLSRVFERFYRVDRARSREAGGTGLGLAIVRQIIAAHQGKIEVESSPGSGATFRVFLRCQK